MKDIYFVGTTLKDLKSFPDQAKRDAGYQLNKIQEGLDPLTGNHFKRLAQACEKYAYISWMNSA